MFRKLTAMLFGCIALVLVLCGTAAMAQTITGAVRGTVTDPSDAVIPGATVTATNVDTGVATHTTSNSAGLYNFQFLIIGKYTITATALGFQTQKLGPFQLRIDQIASVNPKLPIGQASTVVDVGAETSVLNTANATLSTSIDSHALENMPLGALNIQQATMFVPGAVNPTPTAMSGQQATERDSSNLNGSVQASSAVPTFNGNRQQANSYILDGIDINETLQNAIGYSPSPYSIQEMHIITGNADAEFGNVNGGEIIMVTKGGTNQFHGSLFEFHEASGLQANTWFNKHNTASIIPRTNFKQDQFGGAVGGPILKDKLFFFANYLGFRSPGQPSVKTYTVPDARMRGEAGASTCTPATDGNGNNLADLGELLDPNYQFGFQLMNNADINNPVPYPANCVPIVNPVAKFLFSHPGLWPEPNQAPQAGYLITNNYVGLQTVNKQNDQGDIRIDYTLNNNNTFLVKYSYGDAFDSTNNPLPVLFDNANDFPFRNLVMGYTHTFSPRIVNNLRAGYTRVFINVGTISDPSGVFGTNGNNIVGIPQPDQTTTGFAYLSMPNTEQVSTIGAAPGTTYNLDNTFDYNDTLTWEHSNHVTKFGADFVRYQQQFFTASNNGGTTGTFTFDGRFTGVPGSGFGYADFVSDQAASSALAKQGGAFGDRQWRSAVYVQDDWKIRPNLTLNLGMRYSFEQPVYEVNNKQVNVNLQLAKFAPVGTSIDSMLEYAGAYNPTTGKKNSRALYNPYWFAFMPRLGFALSITPRWVVRGGYGVTDELESTGTGLRLTQNAPFTAKFSENAPPIASAYAPIRVENGFGGQQFSTSYDAWDHNLRPAVIQEANLTMQYLLTKNTSFQVGYVGQIGQHLAVPIAANQFTQDTPANCDAVCLAPIEPYIAPYYALVGTRGVLIETASRAVENYNALQATLQRQQSNGLSYLVNYTLAKSMTNNAGFFGTNYDSVFWQDNNNPRGDYGPSAFDARHIVSGTMVYEFPFGHGKPFANWNRLTDIFVGGWQVSANAQLYTGFPLTIAANPATCLNNCPVLQAGDIFNHANQYRRMKIVNRGTSGGQFKWFGTDPSVTPCSTPGVDENGICAYGQSGDAGTATPGTERGPAYQSYDLSLVKGFRTFGGQSLKARVDAFNAFNISSYSDPGTSVASASSFGVIGGTRSGPRTIQLSVVYQF